VRTGETTTTSSTTTYFIRKLSKEDKTIPFRFVGSYEYANCLDNFNKLLGISTEDERKIYDEFLNQRPEFTYYQGVNTAFNEPPDMRQAQPEQRSKFDDKFQKGGMAWMMSLAQIELAATMAMYSSVERPFGVVATSEFCHEQYRELLIDDVISHLRSLAKEEKFREVLNLNREVDTWTIAYCRRLKVIKDMMITIAEVSDQQVVQNMKPYFDELDEHEENLVSIVNTWLFSSVNTTDPTVTTSEAKAGGRLMGGGQFGTAALTPELIKQCNQRIGQTVTVGPGNQIRVAPPSKNSPQGK